MTVLFRPDIPPHIAELTRHLPPDVKRSVKAAIRSLAADPYSGAPLMRELEGLWKYRVKRFRIVYRIGRAQRVLRVLAVGHRRGIYEEVSEFVRRRRISPSQKKK